MREAAICLRVMIIRMNGSFIELFIPLKLTQSIPPSLPPKFFMEVICIEFFFLEAAEEGMTSLALVVFSGTFFKPRVSLPVSLLPDGLVIVLFLGEVPVPYLAVVGFFDPVSDYFFTVGDINLFLEPVATESWC